MTRLAIHTGLTGTVPDFQQCPGVPENTNFLNLFFTPNSVLK